MVGKIKTERKRKSIAQRGFENQAIAGKFAEPGQPAVFSDLSDKPNLPGFFEVSGLPEYMKASGLTEFSVEPFLPELSAEKGLSESSAESDLPGSKRKPGIAGEYGICRVFAVVAKSACGGKRHEVRH